jgi:superfamily I DNA/RNA helicase
LSKIDLQLKAYPSEFIGILTPRKDELRRISELLRGTSFYKQGKIQMREDIAGEIDYERPIVVSTIHSAKGLEFRALHLCYLEYVKKFPKQRNTCFTGVTRAKTALYIYHIDGLPGYFEQAYASLKRPPSLPVVEDLFKKVEN